MSDKPADYSWYKRLRRYADVMRVSEAAVWQKAGETDCFDIHEFLDQAEARMTKVQKAKLAEYGS